MHWTTRRRARANIGKELANRGWRLYGWKEDKSDPMTDYYNPESWAGIATHPDYPGVVAIVDAIPGDSGRQTYRTVTEDGDTCERCKGSGIDPSGWTLEEARKNPRQFNREFIELTHGPDTNMRALMPDVVSPRPFTGISGGPLKCVKCHGVGHEVKRHREPLETWPEFTPLVKGKTWHVEIGGRVVKSGVGLKPCADYDDAKRAKAVNRLCDRIEAAAGVNRDTKPVAATDDVTIEWDRAWLWVSFASKPAKAIRDVLKRFGGRWSRRRQSWYFKDAPSDLDTRLAEAIGL